MRWFYRIIFRIFKRRNLEDQFQDGNQALGSFFSFRTAATFSAACLVIYIFFRFFQIDWASITETLKSVHVGKYFIAFIAYYVSFLFRGMRWKVIAQNASQAEEVEVNSPIVTGMTNLRSTALILCGWFVNSLMWFRLGDAYRAYCLGVISKLGFPWALGTLVAERLLDMAIVFVAILFSLMMFSSGIQSQAIQILIIFATIITLLLFGLVLLLVYGENRLISLVPPLAQPYYLKFKTGVLKSFNNIVLITGLGLLAWVMECIRMLFVIESLNIEIPIYLIILASMSNAVLSTFPTPGGIGFVEPGLTGILLISAVSSDAASVALLDRSITYLSILIFGGVAFLFHHIRFIKELDFRDAALSYSYRPDIDCGQCEKGR